MMLSFPPAMPIQDDLAALLARNLVLTPGLSVADQPTHEQQPRSVETPNHSQIFQPSPAPAAVQAEPTPIIYSVSQHYHHSTHTVRQQQQQQQQQPPQEQQRQEQQQMVQELEVQMPQRPSSEPPQSEHESCETILRSHGINPSALSPSQTQLFMVASLEQKMRLLELWSICPPTSREEDATLAWHSTTVEQEEHLARMRYDRQQQHHLQQQNSSSIDMDCGNSFQGSDGKWLYSSSPAEPYMQSGYEELMRRDAERQQQFADAPKDEPSPFNVSVGGFGYSRSTDPVYKNSNGAFSTAEHSGQTWAGLPKTQAGTADAMEIM